MDDRVHPSPPHPLIAKCWADESFKQRLLAEPAATLAAEGIAVPEGVTIRVLEDTAQVQHLVIPLQRRDLPDAELADAPTAGGCRSGLEFEWCFLRNSPGAGAAPQPQSK
jgi:hypothetical protein